MSGARGAARTASSRSAELHGVGSPSTGDQGAAGEGASATLLAVTVVIAGLPDFPPHRWWLVRQGADHGPGPCRPRCRDSAGNLP